MNPLNNEINIEELSTAYSAKLKYHSDIKGIDYDAAIFVTEHADGKISLSSTSVMNSDFCFHSSDPDRVIAIATLMSAAAEMVKRHNKQNDIDTTENEC